MKKYYLTFALIVVIGVLIAVGYTALKGKIFADVPAAGDNPSVTIRPITLFSDEAGSPATEVNMTVARGAKESFELVLDNQSSKEFSNITVYKQDLSSLSNEKISKDNIDERVIHNWQQRVIYYDSGGIAKNNTFKLENVDELLVKNDKTDFFSKDISTKESELLSSSGSVKAKVVDSRLEPVSVVIAPNSSRKFVFSITVPYDKSGQFSGEIKFVDTTSNQTVKSFKLNLNILGIDLVNPASDGGKTVGCFSNDTIAKDVSAGDRSEATFRKRMQVIKETGCDSLVMRIGQSSDNIKQLEIVSELGFAGPIIVNYYATLSNGKTVNSWTDPNTLPGAAKIQNPLIILADPQSRQEFKDIIIAIKNDSKISVPIMFYGLDEPNINNVSSGNQLKFQGNKTRVDNILAILKEVYPDLTNSNVMAKVVSAANLYASEQLFKQDVSGMTIEGIGDRADIGIFSQRIKDVQSGQPLMGTETYYFQGWNEKPNQNRFLSGFGFVKTGMSGYYLNTIWGYTVQSNPLFVENEILPAPRDTGARKQMLTFYPASDGLIPTVESEGFREGILDLKYYLTYKNLSSNLSDKCSASTQELTSLGSLASQIDQNINTYEWTAKGLDDTTIKPEQFEQTRELIKTYILNYQETCKTQTIQSTEGFRIISPTGEVSSSDLTKDGKKVFSYDATVLNWLIAPAKTLQLESGNAYYIYNYSNNLSSIALEPQLKSSSDRILNKGWNLLSSKDSAPLSQIQTLIKDDHNQCVKTVSLQTLINMTDAQNKHYAYSGVFVVVDDKTADANKAFKLYGKGADKLQYIPANKGFWYYLFKLPSANDAKLTDFDCR